MDTVKRLRTDNEGCEERGADSGASLSDAELDEPWVKVRAAFVAMIKEENFYNDFSKWSLKQCWAGPKMGFADEILNRRWLDFQKGWDAAAERVVMPQKGGI